jgi:6-hydroxynicotinate 3-monooxygenase
MTARIAIVGGGLGGSTAGVLLQRAGFQVDVYEQAEQIQRIGAGIHLQANTMRVMEAAGLANPIYAIGIQPKRWLSREWDTGRILFEPKNFTGWVVVHRGDLLEIFIAALKPGTFHPGKRLVDIEERGGEVELTFADRSRIRADVVIGADGINSRVRELLLGPEDPHYSGFIAYRSIFSASLIRDCVMPPDRTTKWWSDARHWDPTHIRYFMIYYLTNASDEIYFVTGAPDPDWKGGTQPMPASKQELRACYAGFHPEVQGIIEACPTVSKWPVFVRKPLPLWSRGQIVLLGDACHPMAPYMGQGAGMAIEDAAVLMRCLQEVGDPVQAFEVYRKNRIERTSVVQKVSHDHTWLAYPQDTEWVWGYDAMRVPLEGLPNAA